MSSTFPQTAIGLPSTVQYTLPPSLADSARAYSVSVSPNGITSVTSSTGFAAVANVFVANANMPQTPFNSQMLAFDIPCGGNANTFLDPRETFLSFRLTWNPTEYTATNGVAMNLNLISSAASFFDTLTLYHNNSPIETITNYNLLSNMVLNSTVNTAERYGGVSVCMGCDTDTSAGIDLPVVAAVYYMNFSIPLISFIGLNSDKLIPVGLLQNLQLQMQTAAIMPITSYCTVAPTSIAIAAPVLDQFALNMKYIDLGPENGALLRSTYQDGKIYIKSQTYLNSNVTVPIGTSGLSSLAYQVRANSVKSLFIQHCTSPSALCPNGLYDAVNPALTSAQMTIAGSKFPQRPLNPSLKPAETYSQFISSWGGSSLKSMGGVGNRSNYGACIPTVPTNADNACVISAAGLRRISSDIAAAVIISKFPHMHWLGFDLEKLGGTIFSGLNTRSSPPYLEMNFGVAVATLPLTSVCWALCDAILIIDIDAQQITSYV